MRQDKERLIKDLRLAHQKIANSEVLIDDRMTDFSSFDFRSHPAFEEVRILSAVSKTLGIPSPFFRTSSGVDGSKTCINGKWLDNYCSYNYLGLNQDPRVAETVAQATVKWGVSATASRIVGGEREYHTELEIALATFLGTEAALTFVSGHATNVAAIRTLVDENDVVFVDALAHNSIYEGIVASGASHFTFPHNVPERLQELLESKRSKFRNAIIASEGLFSMDGDLAFLEELVALKERYDAWLLLDEAHSIGVVGPTGRGVTEETNISIERVDILMGTLSKSLCACGGFIAGSGGLIDLLKAKAPGFVYSVGLPAPIGAAAKKVLEILTAEPERVTRLREISSYFHARLLDEGINCGSCDGYAIVPVILGDSILATRLSDDLLASGINVSPIIAPAVPEQSARLRFFLTADHTISQVDHAVEAIASKIQG